MRDDRLNAEAVGTRPVPTDRVHPLGNAGLQGKADPLGKALLDSRQRWQGLVAMAADFAYETDAVGCFVFLWPDVVLGWPAASLLGRSAEILMASPGGGVGPFAVGMAARGQRIWLRQADGATVCYAVTCLPLLDPCGGSRGIARDITDQDLRDGAVAAKLRRSDVLDHILWRMRQEVLAGPMMRAVLEALMTALSAQGAAVLNLLCEPGDASVLHHAGADVSALLPAIHAMIPPSASETLVSSAPDGSLLIACPSVTRFGEHAAIVLWRSPGGALWDGDDVLLAGSATAIIRIVLEHDAIQRELARQAHTDPLTGLLNRRSFLEELARRVERLDREGSPGTLMFIDLDSFKTLNDACGHEVGDEALALTAELLRDTFRPSDLVARLGGDEFAIWLDGADELTAAERAESLRLTAPGLFARELKAGAPPVTLSIGIACRRAGDTEDLEVLMHRADSVMYEVKRGGRGHWKVAHESFFP